MNDPYHEAAAALPEDVRRVLRRADGFLDLRMADHARRELETIPPAFRDNLVLRRVAFRLAYDTQDWPQAAEQARELAEANPEDATPWIGWAYATRRLAGIEEARRILTKARKRFPGVAVIPFNLACYACQQLDLDTARRLLEQAFALDASFRETALEDEDLKPLWDELRA
jgi:Flp pilus assembly protein TadD